MHHTRKLAKYIFPIAASATNVERLVAVMNGEYTSINNALATSKRTMEMMGRRLKIKMRPCQSTCKDASKSSRQPLPLVVTPSLGSGMPQIHIIFGAATCSVSDALHKGELTKLNITVSSCSAFEAKLHSNNRAF